MSVETYLLSFSSASGSLERDVLIAQCQLLVLIFWSLPQPVGETSPCRYFCTVRQGPFCLLVGTVKGGKPMALSIVCKGQLDSSISVSVITRAQGEAVSESTM